MLKTHGLRLKFSKIKRFGYKGAVITGVKTTQSGKLRMLNRQGHKVIKMLNEKSIENYHTIFNDFDSYKLLILIVLFLFWLVKME